jgi:hypothetical protein
MRRLQIFLRLKWEEVGTPLVESVKDFWKIWLGAFLLYLAGLFLSITWAVKDPVWFRVTLLPILFGIIIGVALYFSGVFIYGLYKLFKFLADNWKEAGRILEEEKKNENTGIYKR